jgi:hypothetical protein
MSAAAQLRKQYIGPADSKEAQTSLNPLRHSPGTAQQSASDWQVWVQYPFCSCVKHVTWPWRAAASSVEKHWAAVAQDWPACPVSGLPPVELLLEQAGHKAVLSQPAMTRGRAHKVGDTTGASLSIGAGEEQERDQPCPG